MYLPSQNKKYHHLFVRIPFLKSHSPNKTETSVIIIFIQNSDIEQRVKLVVLKGLKNVLPIYNGNKTHIKIIGIV